MSRRALLALAIVGSVLFAAPAATAATTAPAVTARRADFPDLVLPQGVRVNIHFTRGHERDLDLIAAAGFRFVRMDFSWGGTERTPGTYHWADYDGLTAMPQYVTLKN
jgi:hypothetical protein